MASALRSGRAAAEPGVCPPRSTGSGGGGGGAAGAGGDGRRRWCWRGAGGRSVAANCLLTAGMLSLLVRCATAAEENPTLDASASLSLPSDPTATAAPARPLTDLSAVEVVPFSAAHSDGDSESAGGGLSGQPAFSSVLTVMAGTVKHPVSLDQSRTSPTATRDETHTTQWPSHSFSRGSEMSSSLSYAGDRIPPSVSGLTSHQHNTQPVAVSSPVSGTSHVFFMDGNTNVSLFSSSSASSPSLSSSMSSPAPSTYSLLLSLLSRSSSTEWINNAASTQGERIVSSPAPATEAATLSPARPHGLTDSLKTAQPTTPSIIDLPAAQRLQSTTTQPAHFASETSDENSNKITKNATYSSADQIYAASGTYSDSKVITTPATSTHTSYSSPKHGQNPLKPLYELTQTQLPGTNSVSADNLTISTSFPSNEESQAVPTQQGGSQNPTSALLSAQHNGYSVSSHVTQQMLYRAAYAEQRDTAAVDSPAFVHKSLGHAVTSPPSSHTVSPAVPFRPFLTISSETAPGKESLSQTAITEPIPILPDLVSSEPASNSGDLVMAAGHDSDRAPAININNNQGEEAGAELKSISTQAHQNNSLSSTERRPESTSSSITRAETTSLTPESGSVNSQSQDVTNLQQFVTQRKSPSSTTQERSRWTTLKIFSSNSTSVSLSGPVMPVRSAEDTTHETTHGSFSQPTEPTYSFSLFLSHSPDHSNTKEDSSEVNFAEQASLSSKITSSERPGQTLQHFPSRFYTKSGLMPSSDKSQQRSSPGEVSAFHLKSEGAGYSKLLPESTSGPITRAGTTSFTSQSDSVNLQSHEVTNLQQFVTHKKSPSGTTQERSRWTMLNIFSSNSRSVSLSGPVMPVRSAKDTTHKTIHGSFSHTNYNNTKDDMLDGSEVNITDQISDQTRSLQHFPNRFYTTSGLMPSPDKSQQRSSSSEVSTFIFKSERAGHSEPLTFEVQTYAGNSKSSQEPTAHTLYAESLHRNTAESSVSQNEGSTLIRDATFYMKGEFTADLSTLMTTEGVFMLNRGTPSPFPASPETINAELGRLISLSLKHDVKVTGPSSSRSEITTTPRTNSSPHTRVSGNKSEFHFDRQTAVLSTASSAATTSSSDRQNSIEAASAIFSSGTKLMAPYTKWKATEPGPFHSGAFHSENTSSGFDRGDSNSPADGPSHEQPNLEDGQERNAHILNSTDPTVVGSGFYSASPAVGGYPSPTHVKGASDYKEQSMNFSPAHLRFVSVKQRGTAAPSAGGSDTSRPLPHITTGSETSSQATLAFVYKNSPPVAEDTTFTLPNSPAHMTDTVDISESKLTGLTSQSDLRLSSSSSESSSPSLSGTTDSQVSSFNVNPTTSMSSKASPLMSPSTMSSSTLSSTKMILSAKPSMSQGTASSLSSSSLIFLPQPVTDPFVVLTEAAGTDELNAGTSRAVALTFLKEKEAGLSPSQSDRITLSAAPTEMSSQVPPLTPPLDTTTASLKLTTTASTTRTQYKPTTGTPTLRVTAGTTESTAITTQQPADVTRRTTTTTTTVRTQTRRTFTPLVPRTSPPRGATTSFISPFTTTTEAPPQQCNITERMWVKTVVSIYVRRNRLDSIQRQNLRRGLSQGLGKALNDTSAQAQVETVFGSPNMTVAYHVTGGDIVYPPSVVLEGLESYGRDKLIADLRQYLPMVTALPLPAALWRSGPATGFQLKTVLQFVGAGDNPRSCRFSQMMEQRLEKVFAEAQAKVLSTSSRLSVQMLSVTEAAGSPAVSLVYTVSNGTVFLNGTTASNLLGQLSAELVGYFLFYPPLIIAEPLEYHNLNTSIATRDFWVITVIQDVDNASLEGQYQSFASLMEQRLAELFVLAGQQGTRFRRATTVGSYTVQMVSIRRVSGLKNPAEMTYYIQHNGVALPGTSAAKVLNTVDSQTMALTLGYFVQLQAEPVVKNPPNNLWIIAAVLAPIAVVTLIIIIITAVLCRKNKNDFKADAIGNLNPRAKMTYRRDVGYYHQPVQGFDYAKQHLGQQGGDEETLPASQDTLVMSLQIRDTPLALEKALQQDGTANKKSLSADKRKSKLPSEDGSVISNESEKLNSGRGLTAAKVTAQQKLTKEETRKRDGDLMFDIIPLCRPQRDKVVRQREVEDPYDSSSGSLQLISIKPVVAQPSYSHPASSVRSHDSAIVNGEVNLALKQKSDIEHYRNKLRLKAKRKGYYDFPSTDGSSGSRVPAQRQRHGHERAAGEHGRPLEPDDERGSTYVKSHRRHSQVGQTAYRSRQSLSSPSPGGTEMDLLVMRERPRRGIRNSGYDTEPELIEETNVDRLMGPRGYMYGRGLKGHSETSTLSSQPSIDEVRQQMHLLLEEAFSLASGGQSTSGRQSHHHNHHQPPPDHYNSTPPPLPYVDVVTSAPGTMNCGRGGLQWVPSYGSDVYQCSLPKPAFRFTQLPEMAMGSPPPLPPRTGPPPGVALRRSTSDLGPKGRSSETSVTEMQSRHDNNPYGLPTRAALPSITAEQPLSNYSGNPITAVYAIPASRSAYSEYFLSTPPTSYHSPSWMSYPPEPEDVPPQWADTVPLPGYVEAFPHPRYPQGSPTRLPLEYNQAQEQPSVAPSTASQQSLPQVVKDVDSMPLSSLSTSALVQAIRQEVAKLAKKQNEMFEF